MSDDPPEDRGLEFFERYPWLPSYLACFFFAVMAICIKLLASHLDTAPIMFFRSSIPILLFVPSLARHPRVVERALQHRWSLLGRGLCGTLSLLFYLVAMQSIPVSEVSLTSNTAPLFAALSARFFLGEPLPRKMLWAFPVSFAGVALVVHGGVHGALLGYVAGVASAALGGLAYSFIRRARELPAELIALAFTVMAALASLPGVIAHPPVLNGQDWALIWGMGLSGGVAQWFMTLGYRYNSAAVASTLGLAAVGFTVAMAYFFLGEVFGAVQVVGVVLILGGTWAMAEK